MEEVENTCEPTRQDEGHDRWLAMQSAYAEYRRASELLDYTRQSADDTNERLKLPVLEGQQWLAFERYFDTRMEFLEARFDESHWPSPRAVQSPTLDIEPSAGTWSALINYKSVLQILAIVLLGTMAFALLGEQKRVRDLETSRDELQVTLNQTRDGLRLLGQKLDAWGAAQHSGLEQVEHRVLPPARHAPVATHRATGRKPQGWRRQSGVHAQQKPIAAKRDPRPQAGSSAAAPPVFRVRVPFRRSKRYQSAVRTRSSTALNWQTKSGTGLWGACNTHAQCASGSGRI